VELLEFREESYIFVVSKRIYKYIYIVIFVGFQPLISLSMGFQPFKSLVESQPHISSLWA
jgi:hypothetical protein